MPRLLPPLGVRFAGDVDRALAIAQAGETIRAVAEKGSVAWKELGRGRLEALYEMAYLRLFIAWELFLEESFLRYLCGYLASGPLPAWLQPPPTLLETPYRRMDDARAVVQGE